MWMFNPAMMQNPLMQTLMQGMRGGANPMPLLQQMAGDNPQLTQMINLISGKSPKQLERIARNLYKERGMDINQIAQQMGLKL